MPAFFRGAWDGRADFAPANTPITIDGLAIFANDFVMVAVYVGDETAADVTLPDWLDVEHSDFVNSARLIVGTGRAPTAVTSIDVTPTGGGGNVSVVRVGIAAFSNVEEWQNLGLVRLGGSTAYPEFGGASGAYHLVGVAIERFTNNFSIFENADDYTSFGLANMGRFGVRGPITGASGPLSGSDSLSGSFSFMSVVVLLAAAAGEARIRSHVSEDAGSLFQATQVVAVESAVSEAFPYGANITAGALRPYREALTPDETALQYYPLPTRNQEMLLTVEGETNLGRMARTYPGPIMIRVADIPGHSGETMTAQQAIQHVFDRWANEFPWFRPLPVPDLRLLVGEAVAAPRQYYLDNPEAGVLTTEAIVIPQDGDDRRTMREIVDEWLSIFPGTIVRQNAAGSIELVPRVGPDAPDDAAVTLGWRDIISMSDGEDDPRGVVNRARCVSQGWTFEEDQALTPPLYVLGLRSDGLQESALEEVVDDLTSERLADGGAREFETFAEPDKPLTIDWRFRVFTAGTPTSTSLTTEADLNGSFQMQQTAELEVSWFIFGVDNEKTRVRFTRQGNGIRARFDQSGRWRFGPNPFAGTRYAAYVLEFTVAGTGWVRANEQVVGEFSSSNGDFLPDVDDPGQNALEVSESLFGEREATIRSSVFHLTPEQAQAVAQGYVLFNINPRTIREVQQSEWNRYPVKFDHVGRLVDLPNGERAVIENRSYSDSFAPDGGFMQSTFTATVQELVIDTTTEYLFLDNGEFMRLDDGSLVEAS